MDKQEKIGNGRNSIFITPDGKYFIYAGVYWVSTDIIEQARHTNFIPYVNELKQIPDTTAYCGQEFTFKINDSTFIDDDGNETLTLNAKLSNGSDLPDSLIFDPETKTFAGKIQETGNYNIKVTAVDTAGANVSDIFILNVVDNTKVTKQSYNNNFKIYPNPAQNTLQIESLGLIHKNVSYKIIDLSGKTLQEGKLTGNSIDISKITKGNYLLSIYDNGDSLTSKFIIE